MGKLFVSNSLSDELRNHIFIQEPKHSFKTFAYYTVCQPINKLIEEMNVL